MRIIFTKIVLCGWLLLAGVVGVQAQGGDQLSAVRSAIANGSSRELSQYLAPSVEVGLEGERQTYNATQAELVMKNFFAKNTPEKFEIVHQGASPEGIPYIVGRYAGRTGSYRVFIKLKANQSTPTIDTLDFTKE